MQFQTKHPGPWIDTDKNDLLTNNVGEWRYREPQVDKSKCTRCGMCYLYCPTGCVKEDGQYFEADLAFCKGCGVCAKVCPAQAVSMKAGGK